MKNILIVGALGHIGSALIRSFSQIQEEVNLTLIDSLKTAKYNSLFNLPEGPNYKFFEGDVREDILNNINENIDCVVHLAALTDAASRFNNPDEVENVNFTSTKRIAQLCCKQNAKLIHISSTSVYGTQDDLVDENCSENELKPQSPYAATKLKEERYVKELCNKNNLEACIFRFGTIFGVSPGIRFHTAVNKF